MKPLYEDQIHTPAWQKLCDYIWAEKEPRGYEQSVVVHVNPNLKMVNYEEPPGKTGVIFIGISHLIERVMMQLPSTGRYILVHRTNDRSFTERMAERIPDCVSHIYTVDCGVSQDNVTAIPFGTASIMGEDNVLKMVATDIQKFKRETRIFACYNINPQTHHRNQSIPFVSTSPLVKYVKPMIDADYFHSECKNHEFVMALAGLGFDASRQWSAMTLGSIPIVTNSTEMRHFSDMPMVYCPPSFDQITNEWLDEARERVQLKSTDRMRMSYWEEHLSRTRKKYAI